MIPQWNASTAALPPVRPGRDGASTDRSPYVATLQNIIERFATTPERRGILRGFLSYRKELHTIGITDGFQWLNGSFMENKEALKAIPPNDIDVVTFYHLPDGMTQRDLLAKGHLDLFDSTKTKAKFFVDAYQFQLGRNLEQEQVRKIAYWYSMWSHRRDTLLWKGFVQVDMSSADDEEAGELLTQIENEEAKP